MSALLLKEPCVSQTGVALHGNLDLIYAWFRLVATPDATQGVLGLPMASIKLSPSTSREAKTSSCKSTFRNKMPIKRKRCLSVFTV